MRLLPLVAMLSTIFGMAASLAPPSFAADADLDQTIAGTWRNPAFVAATPCATPRRNWRFSD
jgi:hypothetical protein